MSAPPCVRTEVRRGVYHDSVELMRLQAALASLPGVLDAGVVMATPVNRELLVSAGLLEAGADEEASLPGPGAAAGADDLLIAVRAATAAAAEGALAQIDALLDERRALGRDGDFRPRSLPGALALLPAARWVLVSVAGRHAAGVAREALARGRNVFLFSDNVAIADEVALKREARERGLLLLGPDCGTAIVGGVGLGFANRVRRGAIGLVGASGTGLQAVACEIHRRGAGVSQALGTGGRDLAPQVGGATTAQALDLLRRDPETAVIVLLGKAPPPPAQDRASDLLAHARAAGKPVVVALAGAPLPGRRLGNLHFEASLAAAAERAVELAARPIRGPVSEALERAPAAAPAAAVGGGGGSAAERAQAPPSPLTPRPRYLRGLFAGGTLAGEALAGLATGLAPLYSNLDPAPVAAVRRLDDPHRSRAHTVLDLGADELTVGRLHPLLDHDLRRRRLRQEADDPEVAVLLLDLVLGVGVHSDPASAVAPAVAEARAVAAAAGRELAVLAVVIGTEEDPQGLRGQQERLAAAGARIFSSIDEAVGAALDLLGERREPPAAPVPLAAVAPPLAAINVGLESFYESLRLQGAQAVQLDWRPPAGGDAKLASLLERMRGSGGR